MATKFEIIQKRLSEIDIERRKLILEIKKNPQYIEQCINAFIKEELKKHDFYIRHNENGVPYKITPSNYSKIESLYKATIECKENGFTILTATYKNIIGGERTHKIAFSINRPFLGQLFQSSTPVTKEELKKIKSIIDKETAEIEKAKKITELESQLAEFQKKIESEIKKLKTK